MSDERSLGSGLKQLVGLTLLLGLVVAVGVLLVPLEEGDDSETATTSVSQDPVGSGSEAENEVAASPREAEGTETRGDEKTGPSEGGTERKGPETKEVVLKTVKVVREKASRGTTVVKEKARDVWDSLKAKGWWPAGSPEREEPEKDPDPTPHPVVQKEQPQKPQAKVLILPRITDDNTQGEDQPDVYEWVGSVDRRMSQGSGESRRSLASASAQTEQRMRQAAGEAHAMTSSGPGKSKRDAGSTSGKTSHSGNTKSTTTISPGTTR